MYYYIPLIVVVVSETIYQLAARAMPTEGSTFFYLIFSYAVATAISIIMFFVTNKEGSIKTQFKTLNWAPFVLGITVFCAECGFILIYQVGWNFSIGSTICNITVSIIMLIIGIIAYKEKINKRKFCGIVLCIAGLLMINL